MKPAGLKLSPIREDVNEDRKIKNELTMLENVKAGGKKKFFCEILTKVINTAWQNRSMRKRTQWRTDFQSIKITQESRHQKIIIILFSCLQLPESPAQRQH